MEDTTKVEEWTTFDVILYKDKFPSEAYIKLRPFNEKEKELSVQRFGKLRWGVTVLRHGWPHEYYQEKGVPLEIMGFKAVIRAYYNAPESLPVDFEWERIISNEPNERTLYGGVFKDPTDRITTSLRRVREKVGPSF